MFRSLHVCAIAFGAVLVSGCSSTAPPPPVMRWMSNNHASQEKWLNDRNTCYNETQRGLTDESPDQPGVKTNSVDGPICRAFNACLAAHGYVRSDATGTLTIPQDASVQCATPNS
jgi:outer membrane murein-binding lipoprotein Lpp